MITKKIIKEHLEHRSLDKLAELAKEDRRVIRYLFPYLYSDDELLRKRSIEALGVVCGVIAEKEPQVVRDRVRRLWWSINDESGGIGWSAAEAIAEIIKNNPGEFYDYGSIILYFMDEEVLARSVLWAAGTIGEVCPGIVQQFIPRISSFLHSSDPVLRGYAARALKIIGAGRDKLQILKDDDAPVTVYENGELISKTVAGLAG